MPEDHAQENVKEAHIKIHEVNSDQVREVLSKGKQAHLQAILVDSKYTALSLDDWERVIKETNDAYKKYRAEYFDCDDFARCQAALVSLKYNINGCGQVYDFSGEHSYNVLLLWDGAHLSARILEPQGPAILSDSDVGKGHYSEKQGIIIL